MSNSGNEVEVSDKFSIGSAFNLNRKFERLHISRENLSQSQLGATEAIQFSGLGKRTFRELERWDIEEEKNPSFERDDSRSVIDFSQPRIENLVDSQL